MRRYEYYDSGDDGDRDAYGVNWAGQAFTPQIDQMIASVKLKLFRVGSPGTLTVSIRLCSGGKPMGGDLCVGTIDANTLTVDTNGDWYEITLGNGYDVDIGSQYAIVIRALNGDTDNKVSWRTDGSSPTYAYGTFVDSSDSGVDWNTYSGVDALFEVWGVGPPSATTVCWGNLVKSQISGETVEEAIARLIQSHEDDADAHVEAGESLHSHKAAAVIDHIVDSIIEDKIKDGEITKDKINVTVISDISGDLGSITAGTITGALLQTSTDVHTGVKISSGLGGIDVYGQTLQIKKSDGNTLGTIGANVWDDFYIVAEAGDLVLVGGDGGVTIEGDGMPFIKVDQFGVFLYGEVGYYCEIDVPAEGDPYFLPYPNNVLTLGKSDQRWKNIYVGTLIDCSGATVKFTNLPASDPEVAGQLWNDSGTVKISSGA